MGFTAVTLAASVQDRSGQTFKLAGGDHVYSVRTVKVELPPRATSKPVVIKDWNDIRFWRRLGLPKEAGEYVLRVAVVDAKLKLD